MSRNMRSGSQKGRRKRGGGQRLGKKGGGNKKRHSKTLKDCERTRKCHKQIDMESLVSGDATGNQKDLSATGQAPERQQVQTDDHNSGQESAGSNCNRVENWWRQTPAQTLLAIHRLQ
jgi:hypothetical protein